MKLNIKEAVYAIFSAFKHAFLCTRDLEVFSGGGRSHCNTVQIKYITLGLGGMLIYK